LGVFPPVLLSPPGLAACPTHRRPSSPLLCASILPLFLQRVALIKLFSFGVRHFFHKVPVRLLQKTVSVGFGCDAFSPFCGLHRCPVLNGVPDVEPTASCCSFKRRFIFSSLFFSPPSQWASTGGGSPPRSIGRAKRRKVRRRFPPRVFTSGTALCISFPSPLSNPLGIEYCHQSASCPRGSHSSTTERASFYGSSLPDDRFFSYPSPQKA